MRASIPPFQPNHPVGLPRSHAGTMKAGISRIDFRQGQHRFTAWSASRLGLARRLSGQNPTKGRLAQSPAPPSLSIKANRSPSSMKIRGDTVISCNYSTPPFLRAPRQRLIMRPSETPEPNCDQTENNGYIGFGGEPSPLRTKFRVSKPNEENVM